MAKALKTAALEVSKVTKTDNIEKARDGFFADLTALGNEARTFGSKSERCQLNAAIRFAAEMQTGGLLDGVKDAGKMAARAYNPALTPGSENVLASEFNSFAAANGTDYSVLDNAALRGTESLYRAAIKLNRAIKRHNAESKKPLAHVTESFVKSAMAYKAPAAAVKPETAAKNAFDNLIKALALFNAQTLKLAPIDGMKPAQRKTLRKILEIAGA